MRIESGNKDVRAARWDGALLLCAGDEPYKVVNSAVLAAAKLSGAARPLAQKRLPGFIDLLGWCTWDAFYSKVSAKGVAQGVKSLRDAGVQAGFVILDDGWQRVAADDEFEASPLRLATSQVRARLADPSNPAIPSWARSEPVQRGISELSNGLDMVSAMLEGTEATAREAEELVMSTALKDTPRSGQLATVMPALAGADAEERREWGESIRRSLPSDPKEVITAKVWGMGFGHQGLPPVGWECKCTCQVGEYVYTFQVRDCNINHYLLYITQIKVWRCEFQVWGAQGLGGGFRSLGIVWGGAEIER